MKFLPDELTCQPSLSPVFGGCHPILEAKNLCLSIKGQTIYKDICLPVFDNEILAIIGPSGCGKSSFLTSLNRIYEHIMPQAKLSGDIALAGQSIFSRHINPRQLRQRISLVFQRPNPFPFSIQKNMEFALKACGDFEQKSYGDKIEAALKSVHLWDKVGGKLSMNATELSGGEQQRLCIARGLLCQPDIMLFDEPCSALDPISSAAVEQLIASLKQNCAIIIVTHNLAQAKRLSQKAALFWYQDQAGQLIEYGPTHQLMTSPQHSITKQYISGLMG